jgi:hypothetical protein
VSEVVFLDGLFSGEERLLGWLAADPRRRAHLISSFRTRAACMRVDAQIREEQVRHVRSRFGHMQIVTAGREIPAALASTRLSGVGSAR